MSDILLEKIKLGDLELNNRIIMAPLTRARAIGRVPNKLMAEYYAQRAGAGLILSEATSIDPMGVGYHETPGIWSKEQVEGWKLVTKAVHEKGGRIFLQLWHVGRISHPLFLDGKEPVAPSPIRAQGHVKLVRPKTEYGAPRALTTEEVIDVIGQYKKAGELAKEAGFDGVEVHGANGYLVDQFLQSKTNQRKDEFGGSVPNRSRFLLSIVDELIKTWGAARVGVHLAPGSDSHDMGEDNPKELWSHVAKELNKRKIAFIFCREARGKNSNTPYVRENFDGVLVVNQELGVDEARSLIKEGQADAVSWGRYYISNPDLVERIEKGAPLNDFDMDTFYTHDEKGYTDYPFMDGK